VNGAAILPGAVPGGWAVWRAMMQRLQDYWGRDDHHKGRVIALSIALASALVVTGGAGAAAYIARPGRSAARPPIAAVPIAAVPTATNSPTPGATPSTPSGGTTPGTTPAGPTATVPSATATPTTQRPPTSANLATPTAPRPPTSVPTATPSPQPTATSAAVPTATRAGPLPTATPVPSGNAPTLGAESAAFIARYGQPNARSDTAAGTLRFSQPGDPNTDFLIVQFDTFSGDPALAQRAYSITALHPADRFWSMSEARQVCGAFLPSDVHPGRRIVVTSGRDVTGVDLVYWSSAVAYSFPTGAFVDAGQHLVTPGTFDVFYHYASANDADHIESCELEVGQQQAPFSAPGAG